MLECIFLIDVDEDTGKERNRFLAFAFEEAKDVPELAEFIRKEGAPILHGTIWLIGWKVKSDSGV